VPKKIAFANQSGGSGKTTSAVAVAAALATKHHRRVRVADGDTNRDASRLLGYDDPDSLDGQTNINDVLFMDTTLAEATLPARIPASDGSWREIPNLEVVCASLELAKIDLSLAGEMKREERLRLAYESDTDPRDIEIVDCPASLGLLMVNILMAVDEVVAAVKPGMKEIRALTELEETIDQVNRFRAAPLRLSALVVTDRPPRTAGAAYADAIRLLVKTYGHDMVLPHPELDGDGEEAYHRYGVSRSVKVVESYDGCMPVNLYAPTINTSREYDALADQLIEAGLV
jgi:chromosome partitioning protein